MPCNLPPDQLPEHCDVLVIGAGPAGSASLQALKPRFDLYERANGVNAHPWLIDLLVWRGKKSPRLRQRMAGVLEETSNPGNLIGWKGFQRIFLSPR